MLLIATTNEGKLREISEFLKDLPFKFVSLKDVGIVDAVEENGRTYKENSQKKAITYSKKSGLPAIADDGGLEISALGGAPGIDSKIWAGKNAKEEEIFAKMEKIASVLPDENRNAIFRVVLSFALPDGRVWSVESKIDGIITKKPFMKKAKGYPYRSFFYVPEIKKHYHEDQLTPDETRMYNHRYKAISRLKPIIAKELGIKI